MTDTLKRFERINVLDITPAAANPTYKVMGEGFTEVTESLNPEVTEKQYVSDRNATKRVNSYSAEWSFVADVLRDDDLIEWLREMGLELKVGAECETTMVGFDRPSDASVLTALAAIQHTVSVSISTANGGAAGEDLVIEGTLNGVGDPVIGFYNALTNVFTEDDTIS